ncbi:T9SS type A sorting domain-containing protein [Rubrivirga sp. IMCC43871]|uniref:T9SS type A sorting domain-containing protein n=1 Tax=Rubrivirga sp. IMCC43871 TaxID=3391575 RepID=UPI00398FF1D2
MPLLDRRSALILSLLTAGAAPASGATCTWLGGTASWAAAASWSCGAAPTASDDVAIAAGTVTMDTGAPRTVRSLTLTGGTLAGADSLRITESLVWEAGTMTGAGATVVAGPAALRGAASKVLDRELILTGQTEWSDGTLLFRDGGLLRNRGVFLDTAVGTHAMARAGDVTQAPRVHNQGRWQISSAGTTSNVDVLNEGTLIVGGGGFSVRAPARFAHEPAAVLTGSAMLDLASGAEVAMGGRVEPGGPGAVGWFEVRGPYPMGPQHVLDIDVTQTVPSSDLLQTRDGTVTIAGRLLVRVASPGVLGQGLAVIAHGGSGALVGCYAPDQIDVVDTAGQPLGLAVVATCTGEAVTIAAAATAGDDRPGADAPSLALRSATPARRGTPVTLDASAPGASAARVDVLDAVGRQVATLPGPAPGARRVEVPTDRLPAGLYVVRLVADGATATRRFVVVD